MHSCIKSDIAEKDRVAIMREGWRHSPWAWIFIQSYSDSIKYMKQYLILTMSSPWATLSNKHFNYVIFLIATLNLEER